MPNEYIAKIYSYDTTEAASIRNGGPLYTECNGARTESLHADVITPSLYKYLLLQIRKQRASYIVLRGESRVDDDVTGERVPP